MNRAVVEPRLYAFSQYFPDLPACKLLYLKFIVAKCCHPLLDACVFCCHFFSQLYIYKTGILLGSGKKDFGSGEL